MTLREDVLDGISQTASQFPLKPPSSFALYVRSTGESFDKITEKLCLKWNITVEELYQNWEKRYYPALENTKDRESE